MLLDIKNKSEEMLLSTDWYQPPSFNHWERLAPSSSGISSALRASCRSIIFPQKSFSIESLLHLIQLHHLLRLRQRKLIQESSKLGLASKQACAPFWSESKRWLQPFIAPQSHFSCITPSSCIHTLTSYQEFDSMMLANRNEAVGFAHSPLPPRICTANIVGTARPPNQNGVITEEPSPVGGGHTSCGTSGARTAQKTHLRQVPLCSNYPLDWECHPGRWL
jgi:hypothetical protein